MNLSLSSPFSHIVRRIKDKKQRGLTMVEAGVVLIIGGAILLGVLYAFQANNRRVSVTSNSNYITQISSDLKAKYGGPNQYANVTTALLVQGQLIPAELASSATTAQNAYGGNVTAAPVTLTVANDAVTLTWGSVPSSECVDLVNNTAAAARRVTVGATIVKPTDGVLNTVTLGTACTAAATVNVLLDVGRR